MPVIDKSQIDFISEEFLNEDVLNRPLQQVMDLVELQPKKDDVSNITTSRFGHVIYSMEESGSSSVATLPSFSTPLGESTFQNEPVIYNWVGKCPVQLTASRPSQLYPEYTGSPNNINVRGLVASKCGRYFAVALQSNQSENIPAFIIKRFDHQDDSVMDVIEDTSITAPNLNQINVKKYYDTAICMDFSDCGNFFYILDENDTTKLRIYVNQGNSWKEYVTNSILINASIVNASFDENGVLYISLFDTVRSDKPSYITRLTFGSAGFGIESFRRSEREMQSSNNPEWFIKMGRKYSAGAVYGFDVSGNTDRFVTKQSALQEEDLMGITITPFANRGERTVTGIDISDDGTQVIIEGNNKVSIRYIRADARVWTDFHFSFTTGKFFRFAPNGRMCTYLAGSSQRTNIEGIYLTEAVSFDFNMLEDNPNKFINYLASSPNGFVGIYQSAPDDPNPTREVYLTNNGQVNGDNGVEFHRAIPSDIGNSRQFGKIRINK